MPQRRAAESIFHDCSASYTFHHNVIIDVGGGWPKDNQTPGYAADVGFANFKNGNGGDYKLSSSKFNHAASDRKDVGADLDAIDQATMGVQ